MKTKTTMVALVVGLSAALISINALAAEFKNIGSSPAVMYDAPSSRGQKTFVAPRGMPVEIIFNYGAWTKVRDFAGDLSWVETSLIVTRKNILANTINVKVRASADDNASVVFSADKGVLLEFVDAATPGWVKVKHKDGATGYVKSTDVWGV